MMASSLQRRADKQYLSWSMLDDAESNCAHFQLTSLARLSGMIVGLRILFQARLSNLSGPVLFFRVLFEKKRGGGFSWNFLHHLFSGCEKGMLEAYKIRLTALILNQ